MSASDPHPRAPGRWSTRLLAAATTGYAALLTWSTHYPKPERILGANPPSDKLLHLGAYAMLGALVATTLASAGLLTARRAAAAAAVLAGFAALDEATQPWPPFNRTADPLDWVFDLAGIAVGIATAWGVAAAARRFRGG